MKTLQRLFLFGLLLILFGTSGCGFIPTQDNGSAVLPIRPELYSTPLPPFKPISLAWFYHAPPDGVDASLLAEYFDLFISSRELADGRDRLRQLGSKGIFLQYVVLNEIIQPETCEEKPYDNQAAFKPGDFCTIDRLHPDWFLKTTGGERVRDKPPYDKSWLMDPSNPEWRHFWISRLSERVTAGWDGIFIDNLEARPRYHENDLQGFPDLASFQNANLEFLGQIAQQAHSKGLKVYANLLNAVTIEDWLLYLPYLDGFMIENFAVDWESGDYLNESQWELQMQAVLTAQEMGKEVILVARGDANDLARQEFALASYLLVNNGKAYFRYTGKKYDELLWFMNYLAKPGAPLGDLYSDDGKWKRTFENGQVTVDPNSHLATIDFSK